MTQYMNVCATCGSTDVEYVGSTHHPRWKCNNCKKPCDVKTKVKR